jgi:hypothetical protein
MSVPVPIGGLRPPVASTGSVPLPSPAERADRLAFTFCRLGTTGLIAWALTPPVFVLLASIAIVALYGRAVVLGVTRSRCFLRRPALIMATWATIGAVDAAWFFVAGQRLPF